MKFKQINTNSFSNNHFIFILDKSNNQVLRKIPTKSDWDSILNKIPHETIEFDENGHYNAIEHPDFDEWVKNG